MYTISKMNVIQVAKFLIVDHIKHVKQAKADFLIYLALQFLMVTTIIIGFCQIIPQVCENCSLPILVLNYAWGSWLFIAIQSNLQLIRYRHSSIKGRMLIPPKLEMGDAQNSMEQPGQYGDESSNLSDQIAEERKRYTNLSNGLRTVVEQFTVRPFNSDTAWHVCATCEVYVPPRAWHCTSCQTCILRRDHHCIFALHCIGEDNHANFLGLLLYLSVATFYCTVMGYIRVVIIDQVAWYWWLLKCAVAVYTVFIDRDVQHIVMALNFTGCAASTGIFGFYVMLALRGQTSADYTRKIFRRLEGRPKYSYKALQELLGTNPIYKILWPYHRVAYSVYDSEGAKGSAKDL